MKSDWLKNFSDKELMKYRANVKRDAPGNTHYQDLLSEIDNELSTRLENRPCPVTHAIINLEYIGHGGGDSIYQCPMCKEIVRVP